MKISIPRYQVAISTPYLIQFGSGDMQFFLVAEKELLAELPSLYKAIVALIAMYYVFDIAYPTPCMMNTLFYGALPAWNNNWDKVQQNTCWHHQ